MTSEATTIVRGAGEDGGNVLYVDGKPVGSVAVLLVSAPHLRGDPAALASAVNHLARDGDFVVITDPAGYADAYRSRLATEDPDADWQENVIRLCDFGVPDFAAITPPALVGERLDYVAADICLGVPYRAVLDGFGAVPVYTPLPLTPVPRRPRPAPNAPPPEDDFTGAPPPRPIDEVSGELA